MANSSEWWGQARWTNAPAAWSSDTWGRGGGAHPAGVGDPGSTSEQRRIKGAGQVELCPQQVKLLALLRAGDLERCKTEANIAYGYGVGAKPAFLPIASTVAINGPWMTTGPGEPCWGHAASCIVYSI